MHTFNREKEPFSPRRGAVYALSTLLCLGGMLIYIYPSIRATSLMYTYSEGYRRLETLREYNKKLRLELASRRAFDVIEERARREQGFTHPSAGQVVIIAKKR